MPGYDVPHRILDIIQEEIMDLLRGKGKELSEKDRIAQEIFRRDIGNGVLIKINSQQLSLSADEEEFLRRDIQYFLRGIYSEVYERVFGRITKDHISFHAATEEVRTLLENYKSLNDNKSSANYPAVSLSEEQIIAYNNLFKGNTRDDVLKVCAHYISVVINSVGNKDYFPILARAHVNTEEYIEQYKIDEMVLRYIINSCETKKNKSALKLIKTIFIECFQESINIKSPAPEDFVFDRFVHYFRKGADEEHVVPPPTDDEFKASWTVLLNGGGTEEFFSICASNFMRLLASYQEAIDSWVTVRGNHRAFRLTPSIRKGWAEEFFKGKPSGNSYEEKWIKYYKEFLGDNKNDGAKRIVEALYEYVVAAFQASPKPVKENDIVAVLKKKFPIRKLTIEDSKKISGILNEMAGESESYHTKQEFEKALRLKLYA